jgi:DNA-binding NarL/FixJ family response regulator
MNEQRIRVLVVDDHSLVCEAMHSLLAAHSCVEVVGEARSGLEAVAKSQELQPDVVLMDIAMPGMNGIEATKKIKETCSGAKVLGLTMHDSQAFFFLMLEAGANGYVLKGGTSQELIHAVKTVQEGGVYLTPPMASKLVSSYLGQHKAAPLDSGERLTAREEQVLALVAQGRSDQNIADTLGISVLTVQTHRSHTMKKLNLHTRADLLEYAFRRGYIDDSARLPRAAV